MLVLDDYHTITDAGIHAELRQLIERMPPAVHVALASQVDPPLRLGRMRAMGELAELRDRELRFSDEEAATLLNRVHGLDLSAAELTVLQARIEGWAAASTWPRCRSRVGRTADGCSMNSPPRSAS